MEPTTMYVQVAEINVCIAVTISYRYISFERRISNVPTFSYITAELYMYIYNVQFSPLSAKNVYQVSAVTKNFKFLAHEEPVDL